jgi:hypothetical protein
MDNESVDNNFARINSNLSEYMNNDFKTFNITPDKEVDQIILENKDLRETNLKLSERLQELEKKHLILNQKIDPIKFSEQVTEKDIEIKNLIEKFHNDERELFYKNKEIEKLEHQLLKISDKNLVEKKVQKLII